jgi:hypothetical protein
LRIFNNFTVALLFFKLIKVGFQLNPLALSVKCRIDRRCVSQCNIDAATTFSSLSCERARPCKNEAEFSARRQYIFLLIVRFGGSELVLSLPD